MVCPRCTLFGPWGLDLCFLLSLSCLAFPVVFSFCGFLPCVALVLSCPVLSRPVPSAQVVRLLRGALGLLSLSSPEAEVLLCNLFL
ncbi:MAG: hypothetical protein ACK559_19410 [bacterium]